MGARPVELLIDGLGYPECPRWHQGSLWVSDVMTHEVLEIGLDGRASAVTEVEQWPMGLGFLPDDSLLVVSMRDCRLLRHNGEGCKEVASLIHIVHGWVNDLVVDGQGRAFVSDNGGWRQDDGGLRVGERDAHISVFIEGEPPRRVASDLALANGMVVTPDERTLIVADTYAHQLVAFTIGDDGSLDERRVFAELPEAEPNGICGDADGAVWVGSHTCGFLRVAAGGAIVERIDVVGRPDRIAIACVLGGEDRRQLFMLSADAVPGHEPLVSRAGPKTGRIDVATVDVPGMGWP